MNELHTDILIVGGGTGGCAAALAACALGQHVILTEPTPWVGGQLTSQATPPDENVWIEQFGCTRRYRAYRNGVRQYYRDHYPLTPAARANPYLNPGGGNVSRLCHEPRVGVAVLEAMLAPWRAAGQLTVLHGCEPVSADVAGDRVRAVTLRQRETGQPLTITAAYFLDATELGDLLPLAKVEYVTGAESRQATGELHAVDGPSQPHNVQPFTWCFAMSYDPQAEHVIEKPADYTRWRNFVPSMTPPWPGRLLAWEVPHPITLKTQRNHLFPWEKGETTGGLWNYRKLIDQANFQPGTMPYEVSLVNWVMMDYWLRDVIDASPADAALAWTESRQLALSLFYWLQTEAPHLDGKTGYPGLFLRPDVTGTVDGLAMAAYIRESRRIKAAFTVTEQHVGTEMRYGVNFGWGEGNTVPRAKPLLSEPFSDTVGIGHYRIDLHPSTGGNNYIDFSSLPFQIPLGALVPVRVQNLLPACKNIGTTHVSNGCYRLHPVEWNIGEAAGALAGFCLQRQTTPHAVREKPDLLREFQQVLVTQGFELEWPSIHAG